GGRESTHPSRTEGTTRDLSRPGGEAIMQCENTSEQIADYLAGTLPEHARQELDRHLESCVACREELESAAQTWHALGSVPAEKADSQAMRARFDAMLADSQRKQRQPAGPSAWRNLGLWIQQLGQAQPLLQACAALLLLIVGIEVGRGLRPTPAASAEV